MWDISASLGLAELPDSRSAWSCCGRTDSPFSSHAFFFSSSSSPRFPFVLYFSRLPPQLSLLRSEVNGSAPGASWDSCHLALHKRHANCRCGLLAAAKWGVLRPTLWEQTPQLFFAHNYLRSSQSVRNSMFVFFRNQNVTVSKLRS